MRRKSSEKSVDQKEVRNSDNVDRIVLRRLEQQRLSVWVEKLNEKFDGAIRLSKSDLANFLIRHHANDLSEDEIRKVESEFFDEVRWLSWALNKIRSAKREGVDLALSELMANRNLNDREKRTSQKRPRRFELSVTAPEATSAAAEDVAISAARES